MIDIKIMTVIAKAITASGNNVCYIKNSIEFFVSDYIYSSNKTECISPELYMSMEIMSPITQIYICEDANVWSNSQKYELEEQLITAIERWLKKGWLFGKGITAKEIRDINITDFSETLLG